VDVIVTASIPLLWLLKKRPAQSPLSSLLLTIRSRPGLSTALHGQVEPLRG